MERNPRPVEDIAECPDGSRRRRGESKSWKSNAVLETARVLICCRSVGSAWWTTSTLWTATRWQS